METYALAVKKNYTDLSTGLDKDVYAIEAVYDAEEEALASIPQYDVFIKLAINSIDTNGILKGFESKVIRFEGKLDRIQAQALFDSASEMIWNSSKTRV